MRFLFISLVLFISVCSLKSTEIFGTIKDSQSKDPLIQAVVRVDGTNIGTYSGLDGSFRLKNLTAGDYDLVVTYVGYKEYRQRIKISQGQETRYNILLEEDATSTESVMVFASKELATEESARMSEKNNLTTSNIVSSKVIEVSPDITVSTLIQKMSGISIEEEGSNDGSYAIIRGMDKRYNNTLINGVKVPSPDARNRFVPLDIFPADIIDRLEVHKSVTPDMEADAIGGTVNLVMKNAPDNFLLKTNAAIGYNDMFLQNDRKFLTFNSGVQRNESPRRIDEWRDNLSKNERQEVIEKYFPTEALSFQQVTAMPNAILGLTIGDRFGKQKQFGAVLAMSYQGISRGQDQFNTIIDQRQEIALASIDKVQDRQNSIFEHRTAIHSKLDYYFNPKHRLSMYNAYMRLAQNEAWYLEDSSYWHRDFVRTVYYELFSQQVNQNVYNSTLRGDHDLGKNFILDWSGAFSFANRNQPDRATLNLVIPDMKDINEFGDVRIAYMDRPMFREFYYNYDRDFALYSNLKHISHIGNLKFENKIGNLVRYKDRETVFDKYEFRPYLNNANDDYPDNTDFKYRGDIRDGDISQTYFRLMNNAGSQGDPNNYSITEIVAAGYYQGTISNEKFELTAGLRAEYTDLAFETAAYRGPGSSTITKGDRQYLNLLPGVFFKYKLDKKTNLRASYNQAIARPSFYEFVPAIELSSDGEEFRGNPGLVNSIGNNFDFRYEFFPSNVDKIFAGLFYKHISNPIERTYDGTQSFTFANFDEATNYGVEAEYTKYIKKFGVRFNYSYTKSNIESEKIFRFRLTEETQNLIDQDLSGNLRRRFDAGSVGFGDIVDIIRLEQRPLQGQTDHILNLSVLFKDVNRGIDAQFDFNYTGERVVFVAQEYQFDWWQKPQINLDFSAEKKINGLTIYFKSRNLLNTPREFYMKKPLRPEQHELPEQRDPNNFTFVRRNVFGRNYQVGIKYLFN
jgi:outer membrane receptor protein involved in Fe transport